jgi:hypothetical protein
MARPVARTIAERYLKRRGIGHSFAGRFTPSAVTYENGRKLRLPALLLPMTEGRDLRALLRIFLDPDGQKARCLDGAKRTLGDTRGSVIQLPPDATMNLAEGFEDAESAMVLNDLPGCAAVCGVERYREITIPDHVRRVVIYSSMARPRPMGSRVGTTISPQTVACSTSCFLRRRGLERCADGPNGDQRVRARALLGGGAAAFRGHASSAWRQSSSGWQHGLFRPGAAFGLSRLYRARSDPARSTMASLGCAIVHQPRE